MLETILFLVALFGCVTGSTLIIIYFTIKWLDSRD